MTRPTAILLAPLLLFTVLSCSSKSFPPSVLLRATFQNSRHGTTYAAIKNCLFISAKSANSQDSLSRETLDGLDPQRLGVDGTVFGPYTESALIAGVSVTIPLSQTRFRIFGIDAPNCATNTFAQNFPRGSVAGLFLLGETNADLSTASTASITATLESTTINQVALSTRQIVGDSKLYLPVSRIYRGYSGQQMASSVTYAAGLTNLDGSTPVEIPLFNFLNVAKPISYYDMNGIEAHERYDLLFSIGEKTPEQLRTGYTTLRVDIEGNTKFHSFSGACSSIPMITSSVEFQAGIFTFGNWDNITSSNPNGNMGLVSFNYVQPFAPSFWNAILEAGGTGEPKAIRLSVRSIVFATTTHCSVFTLKAVSAYFQ